MNVQRCCVLLLPLMVAACVAPQAGLAASADSATEPAAPAGVAAQAAARTAAAAVLDVLHEAASRADGERYFALFAPDAVFLGTDARERWSVAQFREYAAPFFSQGRGWTYVPTERHLFTSPHADVVWFDERLHNEKYGEVRGSGVVVDTPAGWRIAQYNLSFPVPNELAGDLVARIRAAASAAAR